MAGTLKVKIQEDIVLDNQDYGSKRVLEISSIDEIYKFAMDQGALGGKVMGAGGGGFFLFYVPAEKHNNFRRSMEKRNLKEMDWQFDHSGVTQVYTI